MLEHTLGLYGWVLRGWFLERQRVVGSMTYISRLQRGKGAFRSVNPSGKRQTWSIFADTAIRRRWQLTGQAGCRWILSTTVLHRCSTGNLHPTDIRTGNGHICNRHGVGLCGLDPQPRQLARWVRWRLWRRWPYGPPDT